MTQCRLLIFISNILTKFQFQFHARQGRLRTVRWLYVSSVPQTVIVQKEQGYATRVPKGLMLLKITLDVVISFNVVIFNTLQASSYVKYWKRNHKKWTEEINLRLLSNYTFTYKNTQFHVRVYHQAGMS